MQKRQALLLGLEFQSLRLRHRYRFLQGDGIGKFIPMCRGP